MKTKHVKRGKALIGGGGSYPLSLRLFDIKCLHYITLHSHLWYANYNKNYCTVAYYKSH